MPRRARFPGMKKTGKRGRPTAVYHPSDGSDPVVGLMRLTDGRWRASGSEKYTWTERDERAAIAHYLRWRSRQKRDTLTVPAAGARVTDVEALRDAIQHLPAPVVNRRKLRGTFLPPGLPADPPPLPPSPIRVTTRGDIIEFLRDPVAEAAFWPWLADLIRSKPEFVAKRTGIEQLGYLDRLAKPEPSPTIAAVREEWASRTGTGQKEHRKALAAWNDFAKVTGVGTLKDLTPEKVAAWGKEVQGRGYGPKNIRHVYNRVRCVLNHFRTTGKALGDVRHALDTLAVLKAPESNVIDPTPISRADYQKLLAVGEPAEKALLLVMLNLCHYPLDTARLKWQTLDLSKKFYHERRNKTSVPRAACVWDRTIAALKKLPKSRDDDYVFHRPSGKPATDRYIRDLFADLRRRAKVSDEVKAADIRDGAFTEAAAGGSLEAAQIIAGHRTAVSDLYIRRRPEMTREACAAVERAYF